MHGIHFGLEEMPVGSSRDHFLHKSMDHIYTKTYIKDWNEKFHTLQNQLFTNDPGWQLSIFLALPHTYQPESEVCYKKKHTKNPKSLYYYMYINEKLKFQTVGFFY